MEREWREAREKVVGQVRHWDEFFRGHKKYFEVGRVVGRDGEGPEKRQLCEAAKKKRPSRRKIHINPNEARMAKGKVMAMINDVRKWSRINKTQIVAVRMASMTVRVTVPTAPSMRGVRS